MRLTPAVPARGTLRWLAAAIVVLAVGATVTARLTLSPVATDLIDLTAPPYHSTEFPDRNLSDAMLAAGGDDAAVERLLARLTPFAASEIDATAFDDVAAALGGDTPTAEGILVRDETGASILVRHGDQRLVVSVLHPVGAPDRIDGLLLEPVFELDDVTVADVELVLLAAAMALLVAAGAAGTGGGGYTAAGLVSGFALGEVTGWEPVQSLAILAVPAALVITTFAAHRTRPPWWVVACTVVAAALSVAPVLSVELGDGEAFGHLITVESLVGHAVALQRTAAAAATAAALLLALSLVRTGLATSDRGRWWRIGGALGGCASIAGVGVAGAIDPGRLDLTVSGWAVAALTAAALGRLGQLVRRHRDLTGLSSAVADLAAGRSVELATVIGRALDDDTVRVVHRRGDGWVDATGVTFDLPTDPHRVTRLAVEGEIVGAVVHSTATAADPDRLRAACDAVTLSLANERMAAQIRWQLDEVRASRQRIVHAEEEARERLERDLHDGAQQRLTAAMLALRVAQRRAADTDPELAGALAPIGDELQRAIEEIRELARGVRPAVLGRGLRAALDELAERAPLPVTVAGSIATHVPADVETAAYFVVTEGLTNAVRHADAGHVEITLTEETGTIVVRVDDDGRGPAFGVAAGERPAVPGHAGVGLTGLFDRIDAHGGTMAFGPRPGGGTTLTARFPCAP